MALLCQAKRYHYQYHNGYHSLQYIYIHITFNCIILHHITSYCHTIPINLPLSFLWTMLSRRQPCPRLPWRCIPPSSIGQVLIPGEAWTWVPKSSIFSVGFPWNEPSSELGVPPWLRTPPLICIYILVGGLEHFLFSIIYGIILPID